ncbi:protein FAR1-RELATED SEQUENCE 9-like isoform X2 [Olea europaea var. sylvestris]|uniref:protein FAR1-RELATED SEQUENCE 9-like isoform X1 n=1 Tax=Olea europaea var. sylvestris TaxID=158386 RepID=UPI000C1D2C14|nr:protein FAR1-RELATED SEQUENCE 9-like isoform X1 [Olea europaea var. sylvestris]XP_022863057.1 protein FAR1-RELATED SEQUENCE 9-like isoform X2 [Olea europaea var. sylvestris]
MNSSSNRQRNLGGGVQYIMDYLKRMQAENPAFFYAIQGDNEESTGNIFWASATSRMNYNYFGDTVRVDTAYKTDHYKVPFVTFTGLNHHAQPVLFGCALLLNMSDDSLIWLLQTWLQAMSGRHPVSMITDPDQLIQMAVARVLPETRHRFCKWGIFRETQEKLVHVCQTSPTFYIELKKCVNEVETAEEFESQWAALLERFYVVDNEWLEAMYNAREQWVPVYMRDVFFGELFRVEHSETRNSFFDGFVDASTTIQSFFKQYEQAISGWHEKELKADFDTTNTAPVLKTPSPMEKQAANLYTRRIFMKFQEELVETLANPATKIDCSGTVTTYRVAKFGEEHKAHTVQFNAFEMKANCSCRMFEFSGIICRHVLSVFRAKNVLTLPTEYVLKRWTRNAKSGGGDGMSEHASQLPCNYRESVNVRYNNLRQEAVKFVEEGAKSIHVYNVAMHALQEAAKQVAAAKSKSPGATQGTNFANGSNQENHGGKENQAASYLSMVRYFRLPFSFYTTRNYHVNFLESRDCIFCYFLLVLVFCGVTIKENVDMNALKWS